MPRGTELQNFLFRPLIDGCNSFRTKVKQLFRNGKLFFGTCGECLGVDLKTVVLVLSLGETCLP
jgi:hypothetical protein